MPTPAPQLLSQAPPAVLPLLLSDLFVMSRDGGTLWQALLSDLQTLMLLNAPLAGAPTAPTLASPADSSTGVVNAAFFQTALAYYRGLANGLAPLDASQKIPLANLPATAITDTFVVASQAAMLALTAERGDVAVRTDLNKSFILKTDDPTVLAHWQELLTPTDAVLSVFGRVGAVVQMAGDYVASQITNDSGVSGGTVKAALDALAALIAALATTVTANDGLAVHKAGLETITGVKNIARLLSGGVTDDTVTPHQGIGAGSFLRFGLTTADCSLFAGAAGNGFFGVGAYWNGANFVATATTAVLIGGVGANFGVYIDSGLVAGNTFTPTLRISSTSATASLGVRLAFKAGGTAAATGPAFFTAGGPLTTPVAGNLEYGADGRWFLTKPGPVRFSVGGVLFDHFADAGNGTTVETDLYSDSTPAGLLDVNGNKITARYGLSTVANALATRRVKVYYAGTLVLDTGALTTAVARYIDVNVLVIRETAAIVRVVASAAVDGQANTTQVTRITGLTLANAQILKITGTAAGVGAATNDIVANIGTVRFDPAA